MFEKRKQRLKTQMFRTNEEGQTLLLTNLFSKKAYLIREEDKDPIVHYVFKLNWIFSFIGGLLGAVSASTENSLLFFTGLIFLLAILLLVYKMRFRKYEKVRTSLKTKTTIDENIGVTPNKMILLGFIMSVTFLALAIWLFILDATLIKLFSIFTFIVLLLAYVYMALRKWFFLK